jgi:hypothetical protein
MQIHLPNFLQFGGISHWSSPVQQAGWALKVGKGIKIAQNRILTNLIKI